MDAYWGMGAVFLVDSTSYNYIIYPDIYKNIVVWQEYNNSTLQDIYYFDINDVGQGPVTVAGDAGAQLSPDIWERKIVYIDATTSNKKIVLTDIDTKEKNVIFEGQLVSGLTIDSGIVGWVQNSTLYYYDIETKTTKSLVNTKVSSAITKEKKIIYYGYAGNVVTPSAIHIYDTITNKDTEVVKDFVYNPDFDYANGILVFTKPGDNELYPTSMDIFMIKGEW